MNKEAIQTLVQEFAQETHGRTDYGKDLIYIMGNDPKQFLPLKYVYKKHEDFKGEKELLEMGYIFSSHDHSERQNFREWYEYQFQKKLTVKQSKTIQIISHPDQVMVFNAVETIHKNYEILRQANILINGKNLPVQVGEWYAKGIFGLKQVKSSSQKGFDFKMDDKRVEVKVHWSDSPSPKGMKIKRSSVELSEHIILIYVATNFTIKDICFLDSDFVSRKFTGKGHTVFLKDSEISGYFFSKSDKHFDKVKNINALMKFSSPQLAMKLAGRI